MNTDALKKLLGDVVESKIREILPSVLDEYFAGPMLDKKRTQESLTVEEGVVRKNVNDSPKSVRPSAPQLQSVGVKPPVQYVKNNPVLNQILNETVVKIKQEGQMVSGGPSTMTTEAPSVLDNVDNIPKEVASALTRDYSQLLKLSKAKTQNR